MTLLSLARGLALNVGLDIPDTISGRDGDEIMQIGTETGEELARRVQWGALTRIVTLPGLTREALPADYDRMIAGICVVAGNRPVRPLTRGEWPDVPGTTGVPRYYLLEGDKITLWPAGTATVTYQSNAWCSNGTGAFASGDDEPVMDEALFLKGMIARWRRQKGMPYTDEEAEYEAALAQHAAFDDRSRI